MTLFRTRYLFVSNNWLPLLEYFLIVSSDAIRCETTIGSIRRAKIVPGSRRAHQRREERRRAKRRWKNNRGDACCLDFLRSSGEDEAQLRREDGSEYAGQVAAEWQPTKFWEQVKSDSRFPGRVKKRILSSGTLVA